MASVTSSGADNTITTNTAVPIPRLFPDTSKIEQFDGKNFRRWQERVYTVLDMHGVADALSQPAPTPEADQAQKDTWTYANKVCRHTLITTLSNDLFDVYHVYKEASKIWESLILKYTAEDVGKQKFVVGNFYKWEMTDEKDVKLQINEYHKLLEELRAEKINLPDEFVAGVLIEKLPESWSDYKQQLKHKQKQLSLTDLITHIIIEDTNRKAIQAAKGKEMATKANLVEAKTHNKRYDPKNNNNNKPYYKPKDTNPKKKTGNCYVCGKPGHHAAQCRRRAKGDNFQRDENPPKPNVNLVEGDDSGDEEIITAMVSQALLVSDVKKWVVDSGATKHICANKEMFTSFEEGEDHIYLADSRTSKVQGKGKVVLKLTSGKTLALNDVLYVPDIRANLVSVALLGKAGVRVCFESDKIVMTKNNVLIGKGYCNNGLFLLSVAEN